MDAFKAAGLSTWKPEIEFRRLDVQMISRSSGLDIETDVPLLAKFDVGISVSAKFDTKDFQSFLRALLSMEVRIAHPHKETTTCLLYNAGKDLARLYSAVIQSHKEDDV